MILRKNNGFTLIEVIISIAIIAIIGVILSGFISTTLKARTISQDRLKTLALCTSYINEMKSEQDKLKKLKDVEKWLDDRDFTDRTSYFDKTENNIYLKVYINKNLDVPGLFEIKIIGKSVNASELSISTVIKGGK
jgi:prepilin-type N-terminal cleavage/methylation domain-containing protein